MKANRQLQFEPIVQQTQSGSTDPAIANEVRAALIALMQRILIAVARDAEADDDR